MRKPTRWLLLAVIIGVFVIGFILLSRSQERFSVGLDTAKENAAEVAVSKKGDQNNLEKVHVNYVIDGDTIILKDGRHVRYIGIDTPELDSKYVKVSESENVAAQKARAANEQLVLGKDVLLEKDKEEFDQYGRTLAYVWVNGKMAGEEMLIHGYASLMTIPPNLKYEQRLKEAAYRGF